MAAVLRCSSTRLGRRSRAVCPARPLLSALRYVSPDWRSCASSSGASALVATQSAKQERIQRKLKSLKENLDDPDHIFITDSDARKEYGLSIRDIEELTPSFFKQNPFRSQEQLPQYRLGDVVALAKRKLGEDGILAHYSRYLENEKDDPGSASSRSQRSIYGGLFSYKKPYWYSAPSTGTVEGRDSVKQGLISNTVICCVKGSVWWYTGSHALFADLMHSAADVANYSYRILQLNRSVMNPDIMHPYGYAPLRYITADRSFVILAGLGFVVPFYHSISELSDLVHGGAAASMMDSHMLAASAFVFLASMALEGVAVRTAYCEILAQARAGMASPQLASLTSPRTQCVGYLRDGPDVMSVATFCESSSGVVGAGIGLGGLGLSWYFETAVFDVGASLLMASSVGAVSFFLLQRSGSALLGRTLPINRVIPIVERLEERRTITAVYDVKTEVLGTDTVRFKAEVQFNAEVITDSILGARTLETDTANIMDGDDAPSPERVPVRLETKYQELLGTAQDGFQSADALTDWVHQNNAIFYEALAWELKEVEHQIRIDLKDFRNVHIDLEPW